MKTVKEIEIFYAERKQSDASMRLRAACADLTGSGLWGTPEANVFIDRMFIDSVDARDAHKALARPLANVEPLVKVESVTRNQ